MRRNRKIYWKILFSSIAFVAMAVAIAAYLRSADRSRVPAAISDIDFSDPSTLDAFSKREAGAAASYDPHRLPFHLVRKELNEWTEGKVEAFQKTGLSTKRARIVVYNPKVIETAQRNNEYVPLNLFDDVVLKVRFSAPSVFNKTHSLYTGLVEGELGGKVHLSFVGGALSGSIDAGSKQYRIVATGKKHQLFIIEIEARTQE